ncbi:MAG TPA: hypothetical protein VKP64_05785 [Mycobacteriales bacterium]|nr:hypothetical protein [Mycobacteriales bacterium]
MSVLADRSKATTIRSGAVDRRASRTSVSSPSNATLSACAPDPDGQGGAGQSVEEGSGSRWCPMDAMDRGARPGAYDAG